MKRDAIWDYYQNEGLEEFRGSGTRLAFLAREVSRALRRDPCAAFASRTPCTGGRDSARMAPGVLVPPAEGAKPPRGGAEARGEAYRMS
ncbi:MAG: hypothetical protein HY720_13705, partial [Planctomycetes bacterium]|nr:hypothetical protein [Planctomycetota bacterium]